MGQYSHPNLQCSTTLLLRKISLLSFFSLHSKRFRDVGELRKTEEQGLRCSARAKDGARAKYEIRGCGRGSENLGRSDDAKRRKRVNGLIQP